MSKTTEVVTTENRFDWLYTYADKLRFPAEIEEQFREDYHVNTISTMRFAMVLGIVLYSLFGILDIYAAPLSKNILCSFGMQSLSRFSSFSFSSPIVSSTKDTFNFLYVSASR